jgi:hypothetical protein
MDGNKTAHFEIYPNNHKIPNLNLVGKPRKTSMYLSKKIVIFGLFELIGQNI